MNMIVKKTISNDDALRIFADYCSQNSTPDDIFAFDGEIPCARLKCCQLLAYCGEYDYSALVKIVNEDKIHSSSSFDSNTTTYKNNMESANWTDLYEDFGDTRNTVTTVERTEMDRFNSKGNYVALASTGKMDTVDEELWPKDNLDASYTVDDDDACLISDNLLFTAVNSCLLSSDTSNSVVPNDKIDYIIRNEIDSSLSERYNNLQHEVMDIDYSINNDSKFVISLLFPYYEIIFKYDNLEYKVQIAAHNQAMASTGFFGGQKDVVIGELPKFSKVSGGIIAKLSARKNRKESKKESKLQFLNNTANKIMFTA